MRWLLIILLILNLAMLAGYLRRGDAGPASGPQPEANDQQGSIPSLILISERYDPLSIEAIAAPPESIDETTVLACYDLGPFGDSSLVDSFIEEYGQDFRLLPENRQVQLRVDYRVYLPPFESRVAAQAALEEVQARLLDSNLSIESYLINRGELENGISLGLFSNQRNARNVESQLSALGYQVVVSEEPRTQEQIWVTLRELPGAPSLVGIWTAIEARRPWLTRVEKLC